MKAIIYLLFLLPLAGVAQADTVLAQQEYQPAEKVRNDFRLLLQRSPAGFKASFRTFTTDSVLMERGFIYTEAEERMPVLIYKPVNSRLKSFPVVICLHGTGGSKDDEGIKSLLYEFSKNGMMGVAIDARYHGERIAGGANKSEQYVEAIIKAGQNLDSGHRPHPFFYDTVYDLWRLTDYLITRRDVKADRIGMMGISMGGIETWMAASVDERIKVAVPVIAVQSFQWSLRNNRWQGRAQTIWKAHRQLANEAGDSSVTKENVALVWSRLLPGITGEFDCPSMIRLFAPRPLLLLSNENDPNCPLPGAQVAFRAATDAYRLKNALDKLKIHVTPNEPHKFLPEHFRMTIEWFKKWL